MLDKPVAAEFVAVTPVAVEIAVVPDNTVAAELVAVTDVALELAVVPDKQPVVVTSVTTQLLKNVVQMQILFISVTLIKLAVKAIVVNTAAVKRKSRTKCGAYHEGAAAIQ